MRSTTNLTPRLTASGLRLSYRSIPVLDGVDLDVLPGELVTVVGSSGAGKSSLLHCLCGLLVPQAGVVSLDGTPVSTGSVRHRDRMRRERFGFVFQSGELVPELTVAENVGVPLRLLGHPARAALAGAQQRLDELGVGHLAGRAITDISGGELQRAAIARALVHGPAVVLADEPTGALDDDNATRVFEALRTEALRQGASVVVVTHDRALADRADRSFILNDGVLVAR